MKKKIIPLVVIVILQAVLNIYCLFFMKVDLQYKESEKWFVENSPYTNNYCKIIASQAQPDSILAFNGPAKVTISVYSNNKELAHFDAAINNKGKTLEESNYSVEWHEEYVLLKLYDCDKKYHSYRFYYED
ncbi:MAG: hypothetical protein PUE12_15325 [Oscillospiraceae bacterium]|nr:hypothetical protein [Oscillospiraceae bacterium]